LLRGGLPSTIEIYLELEELDHPVLADSTQIQQVIMNLSTNAYHAMIGQGGRLEVKLRQEYLENPGLAGENRLCPGPYAKLSVIDNGCGMDEGTLARIFEPFFSARKGSEGTGLGLSTTHGIVKNHDGCILVESQPRQGTRFDVYLPLASELELIQTGRVVKEETQTGKGTILLVDDETVIVRLYEDSLSRLGYNVVSFTDSIQALRHFRSKPHEFDLVLTDQTMPQLTGLQLARKILEIRRDIPILLCSGFSLDLKETSLKEAGIHALLPKPVEIRDLGAAIHRAISTEPQPCSPAG
jgi:CheY-like chemotaxis protein